jgi:glucan biosynthesis protein C
LIVYTLLGTPAQIALRRIHAHEPLDWEILLDYWKNLRGVTGPVWYIAVLLIFDTVYALVVSRFAPLPQGSLFPNLLIVITSSYIIRLLYPLGTSFKPLGLQPGYLPQYIACYTLGASLSSPPIPPYSKITRNILITVNILTSAAQLGLPYYYPNSNSISSSFRGGLNLFALSYAIWNETIGYSLGTSILRLFRNSMFLNGSWGNLGRYSYAAFLVHPIVVVGAQVWTDGWKAGGVLKTIVLGTVGTLGSWGVGWALVRLPVIGRVLT